MIAGAVSNREFMEKERTVSNREKIGTGSASYKFFVLYCFKICLEFLSFGICLEFGAWDLEFNKIGGFYGYRSGLQNAGL